MTALLAAEGMAVFAERAVENYCPIGYWHLELTCDGRLTGKVGHKCRQTAQCVMTEHGS